MNIEEIEMTEALAKVTDLGIPTHSYLAAIQYLRDHPLQTHTYAASYQEITGEPLVYATDNEARIRFNYLIQELLRLNGQPLSAIFTVAKVNADAFIATHPWSIKSYATESDEQVVVNPDNTASIPQPTKKAKGKKVAGRKEQAFSIYKANAGKSKSEIIALFVAAGMSTAGAATYFYQCKKELGFSGKSEKVSKRGSNGANKKAAALELYKKINDGRSQDAIIAEFETALATTRAGATTYFYACKAEIGFAGKSDSKRRGKKSVGGKTKAVIAGEIVAANPDADKATLLGLIATACNTTPAGAQTFYYAAKRALT